MTWTTSVLTTVVRANLFGEPIGLGISHPERLIYKNFDPRPYLPQNRAMALFTVLKNAERLADISSKMAIIYKGHDWTAPSEKENLERGLNSARAIWLLFRGAGQPFSEGDICPDITGMADPQGPMAQYFQEVPTLAKGRIGDVVVYRDEISGAGYATMVVDPEAGFAWASLGWDDPSRGGAHPGLGFQKRRVKRDWLALGVPAVKAVIAWRYRRFSEQADQPGSQPGLTALERPCDCK